MLHCYCRGLGGAGVRQEFCGRYLGSGPENDVHDCSFGAGEVVRARGAGPRGDTGPTPSDVQTNIHERLRREPKQEWRWQKQSKTRQIKETGTTNALCRFRKSPQDAEEAGGQHGRRRPRCSAQRWHGRDEIRAARVWSNLGPKDQPRVVRCVN